MFWLDIPCCGCLIQWFLWYPLFCGIFPWHAPFCVDLCLLFEGVNRKLIYSIFLFMSIIFLLKDPHSCLCPSQQVRLCKRCQMTFFSGNVIFAWRICLIVMTLAKSSFLSSFSSFYNLLWSGKIRSSIWTVGSHVFFTNFFDWKEEYTACLDAMWQTKDNNTKLLP